MMGGVNVVLLVQLVWTFTAVCVNDDIINCEDVTAPVGDEKTLTCAVSFLKKECCMMNYKFINTAADDPIICREDFSNDSCKQESRFLCPYTANEDMTTKFNFFVQTTCGSKATEFNVNIADITINCEDVTGHVGDKINLTCIVSFLNEVCCIHGYKFIDTTAADDYPTIYEEWFRRDSCKQESRVSYPYPANKAMTTKIKLIFQTTCGLHTTLFTAIVADAVKADTAGESPEEPPVQTDQTTIAIIICLLSCFIIVTVALILWKRRKPSRSTLVYNVCVCKNKNNFSEHSDGEAMLKETSVNVQIEKQCQCNCNHSSTSI